MKQIIIFGFFILMTLQIKDNEEHVIMNIYFENDIYRTEESEKPDENALAYAIFNKSYEKTGWYFLSVSSYDKDDKKYNDSIKAYAMGYLEGILTKEQIYHSYNNINRSNFLYDNYTFPKNVSDFFEKNLEYIEEKTKKYMNSDPYWEQVHYIYQQFKGLHDGYNNNVEEEKKIDYIKFQILPGFTDYSDIKNHYNISENKTSFKPLTFNQIADMVEKTHCSALVKLANDFSDIWIGHNTWDKYNGMIYIFKEYRFITNNKIEKSQLNVFPSYPATILSCEDFYYLDSNLIVMETTNNVFNETLFENISPRTLLTWVRTILANRLASSAEEWTNIFKRENSGTYNNQFIILDLNKISLKDKKISEKSLMIIEQLPGYTETHDVTNYLKKGYWPSYNVPFSEYIFNISGHPETIKKYNYSNFLDYKQCARAKIFERDQGGINSNEDFKRILRYNDYQHDELSLNHTLLTIASRGDLNKTNISCFGAVDAKFISVKDLFENKNKIYIIAGPTNDQQPTFSWKNTTCHLGKEEENYHEANNEIWNFPWLEYIIQLPKKNKEADKKDDKGLIIIIGSLIFILFVIITIAVIYFIKRIKHRSIRDIEGFYEESQDKRILENY